MEIKIGYMLIMVGLLFVTVHDWWTAIGMLFIIIGLTLFDKK